MRDEWSQGLTGSGGITTSSTLRFTPASGSTQRKRQQSIESLTLAHKAKKLKDVSYREISERRQVGDVAGFMNRKAQPWWRNVTMEEGL